MPGCREPVREGLNGFLVPPRNAEKLAAAMERFLADPALAVVMGANARRCAEEQYDVDKVNALLIDCMRLDRTDRPARSEEHTSELQSLRRISYAVFYLKKKNTLYSIVTIQ